MALKKKAKGGGRSRIAIGGSKKGVMFTLLTIILFVLMLAEVITYVVLNNTYNQQASEASAIIGAGGMVNTLRDGLGPFLATSVQHAINVYLPAGAQLQYPLNSTASAALSSLVYNGMINGTSYPGMSNATVMAFASAMEKQASAQSSSMNIYNSSVRIYQDSPAYINATYTGLAAINTTYGFFTYPLSIEAGYPVMIAYVNLTLENMQPAQSPSPFQQMITFDPAAYNQYENSNLGNIRFYHGATPLFSWCESGCSSSASSATFWVSLPGGIAADSNTTITMGFMPKNVEYSMAYQSAATTPYAGEAPQLSPSYAEYDNGAMVFNFYDNFKGTSLNTSKWSSSGAETIDNGISISPSQGGDIGTISTFSNPLVTDMYAEFVGPGTSSGGVLSGIWLNSGSNGGTYFDGWHAAVDCFTGGEWNPSQNWPCFSTQPSASTYYVWSIEWLPSSSADIYYNYGNALSPTDYSDTSTPVNIEITTQGNAVATLYAYWVRERAYPPGGVMPTVLMGNLVKTK